MLANQRQNWQYSAYQQKVTRLRRGHQIIQRVGEGAGRSDGHRPEWRAGYQADKFSRRIPGKRVVTARSSTPRVCAQSVVRSGGEGIDVDAEGASRAGKRERHRFTGREVTERSAAQALGTVIADIA